jgi:hypothetical protein
LNPALVKLVTIATKLGRSGKIVKVTKNFSDLKKNEVGAFNCSVCIEDQIEVTLQSGLRFKVCKYIADDVKAVIEASISEGFIIKEVLGYNPQMSKGDLDSRGFRTQLSNHSFGVAIDINRKFNGLYENCLQWGPSCRLIQGGAWSKRHQLSIKSGSKLVKFMGEIGLSWGGTIKGKQKDFMHFSPSGY